MKCPGMKVSDTRMHTIGCTSCEKNTQDGDTTGVKVVMGVNAVKYVLLKFARKAMNIKWRHTTTRYLAGGLCADQIV